MAAPLVVSDGSRTVTVRGLAAGIIRRLLEPGLRDDIERPGCPRQVTFHIAPEGNEVATEVTRIYRERRST